jgi:CubicO group peptidase (beta-lactamase class C family)
MLRGDQQQPEEPPANLDELRQSIHQVLDATNTPGVGIALVTRDSVIWAGGVGTADVAAGKPVTAGTLFRIGSASKSFVSLSILWLQESGLLNLSDRVRGHAPEIAFENPWEEVAPVRLEHLLEHTAGFDDIHLTEFMFGTPSTTLREMLDFHPDSRTSRWVPGTHFSYCNSGPVLAAYVVEKVAGVSFEEFVQTHWFDPLQMKTASYFLTEEVERKLAKGYGRDGVTEQPYWHIGGRPSGALNASALDMANVLQFFLNRGMVGDSALLSRASLERMERPETTLSAREGVRAGYGLGNYTSSRDGFLFHGHDGGMNAYLASYAYLPEEGVGFAVMINTASGRAISDIRRLLQRFLIKDFEPQTPASANLPLGSLASVTGYYEPITPRAELSRFLDRLAGILKVELSGERLSARAAFGGQPEQLIPVAERKFRAEGEPVSSVAFVDGGDGRVTLQGFGSAVVGNYRSVSASRVWLRWVVSTMCLTLMASAVGFALVWVPRKALGRLKNAQHLSVRALPLLAVLALAAAAGCVVLASADPLPRLGRPTVYSVGFFLLMSLFALAALLGMIQTGRAWKSDMNRGVWFHSLLVSLANALVVLYLGYWGIIGLRPWAY